MSQIRYFMNKALVLFLTCRMAKKGPSADVDKASNTESERNIHQGSNRGRLGVFFLLQFLIIVFLNSLTRQLNDGAARFYISLFFYQ